MEITRLSPEQIDALLPQLSALLMDAVNGGASVSFLAPMAQDAADRYWQGAATDVAADTRFVFVACSGDQVAGCVHLAVATQPNARHRAEIQKLLVHSAFRRRGVATSLMAAAEEHSKMIGRTLLVLDTEEGSAAEPLYEKLGYLRAGVIPNFAQSSSGGLRGTVLFYKKLG